MTAAHDRFPVVNDAWIRYNISERNARNGYLAVTTEAHRQYLLGPWPDRESYERVERSAWLTYYAAGRDAWRDYMRELENPVPATPPEHAPGVMSAWETLEAVHGLNCYECGIPWRQPSPGCPRRQNNVHPVGAGTSQPAPAECDYVTDPPGQSWKHHVPESISGAPWPASPYDHVQPVFTPNPESRL